MRNNKGFVDCDRAPSSAHESPPGSRERDAIYSVWERRESISDPDANSLGGYQSRVTRDVGEQC